MKLQSAKEIRDGHSSYQRVYFAEEIKQRISFFLSNKLFGKNLDIGGGRYLYYPHSTVIDLSPVALQYNPAKEKIEFDIDSLHTGAKLPFPDNSFDHATMVSVAQYIQDREEMTEELLRVLKPGAELYILSCGGRVPECLASHSLSMEEFFKQKGFSTFIENIPFRSDIKEFQSLCVAMPGIDLFGKNKGYIRNKEERELQNAKFSHYRPYSLRIHNRSDDDDRNDETRNEDVFTKAYFHQELRKMNQLFSQISTYPVTAYSIEQKKSLEAFTQECLAQTSAIPILTSRCYNDIDVDMTTPENEIFPSIHVLGKEIKASQEDQNKIIEIAKKFGIIASQSFGYFPAYTPEKIVQFYENRYQETRYDPLYRENRKVPLSDNEKYWLISFLSEIPLNSTTKALQSNLYPVAKLWYPDIDNLLLTQKAKGYYSLLMAHKQRRKVEELLTIKSFCAKGMIDTIARKNIDYIPITQQFPALLEQYDAEVFRGHHMISDD